MGKYPGMEMKENVRQNEKYFLRRVEHSKFPLRTVRWRTVFLANSFPRTVIRTPKIGKKESKITGKLGRNHWERDERIKGETGK